LIDITISRIPAKNNGRIIHDGNSGIEGDGDKVGVGEVLGDGDGVGLGDGLGEGVGGAVCVGFESSMVK
jgi:hypothetical protein